MASLSELKNNQQQVAHKPKTIFDFLTGDPRIEKAIAAVASKFMTPDRFLRLAVNAVKKTPLLMECDPQTVLGSFMTSAALGLEPNTVQQQAFLIPYKKKMKRDGKWIETYECQFQVGYRGFITLAHRSPHILSLQAEAIHENDLFDHMQGTESFLKFRKSLKDRGELIGAFAYSKLEGGLEIATVLPLDELHKIRSRSETYNALERGVSSATSDEKAKANKKFLETPWVMWEDDMAAKSAIKKQAKQLPLTPGDAIAAAVQMDADSDDRTIDMAKMADPDQLRNVMDGGFMPEREELAAVEHQQSNHLESQTIRPLDNVESDSDAAHTPASVARTVDNGQSDFDKFAARLRNAKDADVLAADADLIRDFNEADQAELLAIYQARKEVLENPPAASQATQRPAARSKMNLE